MEFESPTAKQFRQEFILSHPEKSGKISWIGQKSPEGVCDTSRGDFCSKCKASVPIKLFFPEKAYKKDGDWN